jgi:hypothetical protein
MASYARKNGRIYTNFLYFVQVHIHKSGMNRAIFCIRVSTQGQAYTRVRDRSALGTSGILLGAFVGGYQLRDKTYDHGHADAQNGL